MRSLLVVLAGGLAIADSGDGAGVVGTLTCTVQGGVTSEASRNMSCSFKSIAQGTDESYTGLIRKAGSDAAAAKEVDVYMWEVLADSRQLEHGALAGKFVGAPSEGAQRQVLLKAPGRSPALRPVNPQGSGDDPQIQGEPAQGLTVIELDLAAVKT